ncbi:MAG: tetratricopeptide repeat protein [Anaerolineales bacterium]
MTPIPTIHRITETLRGSDLSWLLPNLRQDHVVWDSILDPAFLDHFLQSQPADSTYLPEDFSPGRLALIALSQSGSSKQDARNTLDSVDEEVIQTAIRSFQDQTLFESDQQDLATAGLIALALLSMYIHTNSWVSLLDEIRQKNYRVWLAPLACLYVYLENPARLLTALVQPGVPAWRYKLAIHTILSNPLTSCEQTALLMSLCHGNYNDPLPAIDRLALVQELSEQRPQAAVDFCKKWLEVQPAYVHPVDANFTRTTDTISQLVENLFQIEVRRISGDSEALEGLLEHENSFSQDLYTGLIHHSLSLSSEYSAKSLASQKTIEICQQSVQFSENNHEGKYSAKHAAYALTLADQGLYEEARACLPPPGEPLPSQVHLLYAIARVSADTGEEQRAADAATRIVSLLDETASENEIPVWGDQLSLDRLGKLLLDLHKPDEASQVLERAGQICPNDLSLLKMLVQSYTRCHKDAETVKTLRVLVALNPTCLDDRRALAQALEELNDWESSLNERANILEAKPENGNLPDTKDIYAYAHCALKASHAELTIKVCDELLAKNKEDGQALVYSGEAYLAMNKIDQGMGALTLATQVAPHLADAWLALAVAQKNLYPAATVIETLKTASQAVTDSALIHFALGDLYLQDHAPTLALPELQTAVELAPSNPQILLSYAQALSVLGHLEESRQVLSKAYDLEPDFPGLARLYARILVELGRLEEAIAPYETLFNSGSLSDTEARLDYARCVLTLNKHGTSLHSPMKALIALNEVLQIDPENAEAKALTAEALSANGEYELAFQAFREALDTCLTQDKEWFERLSYGFGCTASAIGKHDIAIAALQEAGQAKPDSPAIFKALSDAYCSANLPDEAMRSARNVLVIDGENPDQLSWFAGQAAKLIQDENAHKSNSATGETRQAQAEALNALAKAIQLAPTRSDLIVQLGNFQASIGETAEAQKIFASIAAHEFASIGDLKSAAKYLSEQGDHASAIACLENGMMQDQKASQEHDPSLYTSLAQEYVHNHDHTSAINTLDSAIELLPGESELLSFKIDILLNLGQPIEALHDIDTALQKNIVGKVNTDLLFLASQIHRSIGNLAEAAKYARLGVAAYLKDGSEKNISRLPFPYRTQIAEIYRALLQPDQAYYILEAEPGLDLSGTIDTQATLDFICLHTELALESGERIRADIQDLKLEASHPSFSRLMAINARLMNKAGNTKQALQLFQLALQHASHGDQTSQFSDWNAATQNYLNQVSLIEAAQDLGLWDQAWSFSQQFSGSAEAEPLSHLLLAMTIILKAEFNHCCEICEVSQHKPKADNLSSDALHSCKQVLDQAKSILEKFQVEPVVPQYEITKDQIYRWQARADIVFEAEEESSLGPLDALARQPTAGDLAAVISYLHKIYREDPDGEALSNIIKLARLNPRNPGVIFQVAFALQADNPAEAMKSLQSVLEQNPNAKNPSISFCNILLARIAGDLQEFEAARKAVEAALDFWQDEPAWHVLAAQICEQALDMNGAIHHLTSASELAPDQPAYHFALGKTYFENAHEDPQALSQALKSLERANSIEPNDLSTRMYLAHTHYLLHDLDQAEDNARQALLLDSNRADIYQLLSQISIRKDDFQGAYEYASKAMQISPKDMQSTITLAQALSALGRYSEALTRLNQVIPIAPEDRALQLERVNVIKKMNGPRAALDELSQLNGSYPDDFELLNALAKAFLEVDEPENAAKVAEQALKVCNEKTSPHEQANLHLLIGQVLRQAGQLDSSIQHLSQAIELAPNRLEPYLELGLARKERREYQQALKIFEQATMVAPNDPRAPYQAGLALKESKDYKSSETMLRRAVSLAPNDLLIRRQLAAVVALNLVHNPRSGRNNPAK